MLALYGEFVGAGDLCFDIGANIGNRTEVFLALGAKVIAVEPQRSCLEALRSRFGDDPRVIIIPEALGSAPGEAELMVSDASTISSLSGDWVERVRGSGRFASYSWDRRETVPVRTFDSLIDEFGPPAFTKIDVEGFEAEVIAGLSRAAGVISFEFTPEYGEPAQTCVRRLDSLGPVEFNYSREETMRMEFDTWLSAVDMARYLASYPDVRGFGDVYARFI